MKRSRYDWVRLKAEFMAGPWVSARSFFIEKGIPLSVLESAKGWAKEKKELAQKALAEATKKIVEEEVDELTKMRKRHVLLARYMQNRALKRMEKMEDEELLPEDARRLMISGLEEERKALGLNQPSNQTLTQININTPKTNLDKLIEKLDYEGILRLIAELKRLRARNPSQETAASGRREAEEGEIV